MVASLTAARRPRHRRGGRRRGAPRAVERWPAGRSPAQPGGWLTTTAIRKAIDRIRRENKRDANTRRPNDHDDTPHERPGAVEDDRLRLIFTCCHPRWRRGAGRADPAAARRAHGRRDRGARSWCRRRRWRSASRGPRPRSRARTSRTGSRRPTTSPSGSPRAGRALPRLQRGLPRQRATRRCSELTDEAIRLGRVLRTLLPDEGEVAGLLALMLLIDARRPGRVGGRRTGAARNRTAAGWTARSSPRATRWSASASAPGAAAGPLPAAGRRQRRAHRRPTWADTDWSQIAALYDQLGGGPGAGRRAEQGRRRRRAGRPAGRARGGGPARRA